LPEILNAKGPLPAVHARDGEEIRPRRIYAAVPDRHLLIEGGRIGVKRGPKENRFRPSIDALFRLAAYTHKADVIGVVLSGALDDGTSGLWSIKRLGGIAIVQNPQEAAFDSMPLNALEQVDIDYRRPAKEIGPLVAHLATAGARSAVHSSEDIIKRMRIETEVAASTNAFKRGIMEYGELNRTGFPGGRFV
jgi:two-component system, chemotaxis family, protein-glutamate methylesterase/glutaminase